MKSLRLFFLSSGVFVSFLCFSGCSVRAINQHTSNVREVLIADFEDGNLENHLGGGSGSWNLTPEDEALAVELEVTDSGGAGNSKGALKLTYDVDSPENPAVKAGFWTKLNGFDGTPYDHVAFEVRGDSKAGFTDVFLIELKRYKDTSRTDQLRGTRVVQNVTSEWQTVNIPLNALVGLFDLSSPEIWQNPSLARRHLDEFVINLESRRVTQKTGVLYFDNFRFAHTGRPGQSVLDRPPRKGMKTAKRLDGLDYAKFLAARLQGFPSVIRSEKSFSESDREFLKMVARDTWKFFDQVIDRDHQLPLDTIQLGTNAPLDSDTRIGDYTNVTNIGLYLMCVVSAYDLNFISREEAVRRIEATLATLDRLERHSSGFFYNYYDTTTLEHTDYFVSLIDSAWLDAGLYVVKNAFPEELKQRTEQMLAGHDFRFFYDEVEQQMNPGYYAHLDARSDYPYGSLYTEPRAASFIAIGRQEVPAEHWFRMIRTFPEDVPWQTSVPVRRTLRTSLGFTYYGGYYEWRGLQFVPSWGGSMFEALMPTLILDEKQYAPEGLGLNDARHVQGQIRYALEELGYPVWGMSPSSVPEGGYSEFGAAPFGAKGYKAGVVTPHATFLALDFAPEAAVRNARELIKRYPVYGEYGFYDAVRIKSGLVAYKYLSLNQAMILISINNYLNEGAVRRRFHADSINQAVLPLLSAERFFSDAE